MHPQGIAFDAKPGLRIRPGPGFRYSCTVACGVTLCVFERVWDENTNSRRVDRQEFATRPYVAPDRLQDLVLVESKLKPLGGRRRRIVVSGALVDAIKKL